MSPPVSFVLFCTFLYFSVFSTLFSFFGSFPAPCLFPAPHAFPVPVLIDFGQPFCTCDYFYAIGVKRYFDIILMQFIKQVNKTPEQLLHAGNSALPSQSLRLLTTSQYHNGAKAYASLPQAILNGAYAVTKILPDYQICNFSCLFRNLTAVNLKQYISQKTKPIQVVFPLNDQPDILEHL